MKISIYENYKNTTNENTYDYAYENMNMSALLCNTYDNTYAMM